MTRQPLVDAPTAVAGAALLLAAAGLYGAVWSMDLSLRKAAVPPRRPLYQMPDRLGPFRKASSRELSHALADELGTDRHLVRTYRAPRAAGPAEGVRLLIGYYTGWADARPRVPDRLFLVGGESGESAGTLDYRPASSRGSAGGADAGPGVPPPLALPDRVSLRLLRRPRGGRGEGLLAQFFVANGRFTIRPSRVQHRVSDLRQESAYWMKVELMPAVAEDGRLVALRDPARAKRVLRRFLRYALPAIASLAPGEPAKQGAIAP